MRAFLAIFLSLSLPSAWAVEGENTTREFIMSCTYGVMAGTLVGAASLAFTHKPGDNLNRVARGASLGLYTGILLGVYVVYIVPGLESTEEEADPVAAFGAGKRTPPPVIFTPIFTAQSKLDGYKADWTVLSF
jgi:hypothetical protein